MSPKQLTRIGVFYIEEAILDTISQSKADYIRAGDISERIGVELPAKDEDKNWIINRFLDKLERDKRVEARRRTDGAVIDWKLAASEASRRGVKKFRRKNQAEKYREATTLEERKEIGRKVAELRINPVGSQGMAWWKIRERLGLKEDQFHEVIRHEDHYKESCVERIESFEDGWEYNGKLERHLGFKPDGELANRIEACKPKPASKEAV